MDNELQSKSILVIDDDPALCMAMELTFGQVGAQAYTAFDGRAGLRKFYAYQPDLIILDIQMPDIDGWETLRQIRLLSDTPVIILTGLKTNEAIIRGLDGGADDFISKPFDNRVLLSRARAVMRRAQALSEQKKFFTFHDDHILIDLAARHIFAAGKPVKLTATEFRLLSYLLQNANQTLTHQQILDYVWGSDYSGNIDYVHAYLSHLRRKLEKDPPNPRYLLTEHGVGYRFSTK